MTRQCPEILYACGETWHLTGFPLRPLLRRDLVIPAAIRLRRTNARRGYQGYWSIDGNRLCLISLNAPPNLPTGPFHVPSALPRLFPGQAAPIAATWFSGTLHAETGPCRFKLPGIGTVQQTQLSLTIDDGCVVHQSVQQTGVGTLLRRFGLAIVSVVLVFALATVAAMSALRFLFANV